MRAVGLLVLLLPALCGAAPRLIRVAGGVSSLVVDGQGTFAYLANDTTLEVLDVAARSPIRTYALGSATHVDAVDEERGEVLLHSDHSASILDLATGSLHDVISGFLPSDIQDAAFAGGRVYVATLFEGTVYSALPDGTRRGGIDPYPSFFELRPAHPCAFAASDDGGMIWFVTTAGRDSVFDAVHVARTSDDTIIAMIPLGFWACRLFLRDATSAIAVGEKDGAGSPTVGVVDLEQSSAEPVMIRVPHFHGPALAAYAARRSLLILLHGGHTMRLLALDSATQRVRKRWSLGTRVGIGRDLVVTPDGHTLLVATSKGVYLQALSLP